MKLDMSKLSINQKLALLALALGFIAIFMRDPTQAKTVTVNTSDLAMLVQNKSANISVEQLADWLIQKKADFKLIDLRQPEKFKEYGIPTATNVSPADLINLNEPRNLKILVYSDDNLQAAQAWFLLKSKNYKAVYMLSGGINEWKDKILFPAIADSVSPEEKAKFDKISEISKYFGGVPRFAAGVTVVTKPAMTMPKMAAPAAPSAAPQGGKPKREGC